MTKLHKVDIINNILKTEKTEKYLEKNIYCFSVHRKADKKSIVEVLSMLYGSEILSVKTVSTLKKIKVINRKFKAKKSSCSRFITAKKAYVKFASKINVSGEASN